ncbi:MAG: polysaccharide biosynthesis protein [Acidobacteriaceae bacterium]|nr:polysaccharide biosynthesis protein [Acidobacteriaceae bacterium]
MQQLTSAGLVFAPVSFRVRRLIAVWVAQVFVFLCAALLAFLLRFDFRLSSREWEQIAIALPVLIIGKGAAFRLLSIDDGSWRYVSISDAARICLANVIGSFVSTITILILLPHGFPRSIYILDFSLCVLLSTGIRVLVRMREDRRDRGTDQHVTWKRILIYGAGEAGLVTLREIKCNSKLTYKVCGFIDDNPHKKGLLLQQLPVLGTGTDLSTITKRLQIDEILIAIPSATGAQMASILARCHKAQVHCKTVPGLAEILIGSGFVDHIRDVAVEDLLGRTPVSLEGTEIRKKLENSTVLVTGAAGSIGSELCRQIARFNPAALVGFDISETGLFEVENEMRELFPNVPFHCEIGSMQSVRRLSEIFDRHLPSIVYHAAAYKHVPMMETHVFEAIENNIFGTWNVAAMAARHGVSTFVLISSDKAVRPTNMMGASKHVAELVIKALQQKEAGKFVAVRFGNVLGSNGSVVPIFKRQIAARKPITITDPDMKRYFMTIPEAVQLVLQASTMGNGGEIFVLDMGSPVRILDLAKSLILLSGLRPEIDIPIRFTGIRPGEKLSEELSAYYENILPTSHEKIKSFRGPAPDFEEMLLSLERLHEICETRNLGELIVWLKDMVEDYSPSAQILRRVTAQSEPELTRTSTADCAMATAAGR